MGEEGLGGGVMFQYSGYFKGTYKRGMTICHFDMFYVYALSHDKVEVL